jgi:hypothetical protein
VDWILSQSITTLLKLWALGSRQERSSSHGSSSFSLFSFEAEATGFCPLSATSGRVEEVNFCTSSNNNFQTTSPNLCEREAKAAAAGDQRGRRLTLSCAVLSRTNKYSYRPTINAGWINCTNLLTTSHKPQHLSHRPLLAQLSQSSALSL